MVTTRVMALMMMVTAMLMAVMLPTMAMNVLLSVEQKDDQTHKHVPNAAA